MYSFDGKAEFSAANTQETFLTIINGVLLKFLLWKLWIFLSLLSLLIDLNHPC